MKVLILLAALFSSSAFAGDKAGNGGNVVLCKDPGEKITGVKLLDYYEAETIWGFKIDLGAPSLSVQEKVRIALERARRFHPDTADELEARAAGFFDDALLLSNVELTPVDDSGEYFLPVGCKLKQIAVQRLKEFPQDKTFLINKDVWDLLDNDQRAGLVLHEITYEKLLHTKPLIPPSPGQPAPEPESRMARYFNALASSTYYGQISPDQYLVALKDLWFLRDLSYEGVTLQELMVGSDGGFQARTPKGQSSSLFFAGKSTELMPNTYITVRSKKLVSATPVGSMAFQVGSRTLLSLPGREVSIYQNGALRFMDLAEDVKFQMPNSSTIYSLRRNSNLYLDQDGNPLSIGLSEVSYWEVPAGGIYTNKKGEVSFRDGKPVAFRCVSHEVNMNFKDNKGRTFACVAANGSCAVTGGALPYEPWPDSISLDSSGLVSQMSINRLDDYSCRN